MAINNNEKINISGTYVRNLDGAKIVDGKEVEGGYFVCEVLPSWGTTGQFCYCTGTSSSPINKFYQYNGKSWEFISFSDMFSGDVTVLGTLMQGNKKVSLEGHEHSYLSDDTNYAAGVAQNGAAVSANKVNAAVTFNTSNGAIAGTTFDGSTAVNVDYTTVGAAPTSHSHVKSDITDFEHTHNDIYYTKDEVESEVKDKVEAKLNEVFAFDSATGTLTINTLYGDK